MSQIDEFASKIGMFSVILGYVMKKYKFTFSQLIYGQLSAITNSATFHSYMIIFGSETGIF